jgi:hypothetical protein
MPCCKLRRGNNCSPRPLVFDETPNVAFHDRHVHFGEESLCATRSLIGPHKNDNQYNESKCRDPFPLRDTGPRNDERRIHRVFVEILLAKKPMAADRQAVIAGENDEGLFESAARVEGREDATDLLVEELDGCVIVSQVLAHDFRGPRPRRKSLVANHHLAIIEWVLRHEIWRERRLMAVRDGSLAKNGVDSSLRQER